MSATWRSGAFVGVAAFALFACSGTSDATSRAVIFHVPASCQVGPSPYALLFAAGDFQPSSPSDVTGQIFLGDLGAGMSGMPENTRSLAVSVSADAAGLLSWRGLTEVPAQGDVDVLLWPTSQPCALSQPATPLHDRVDAAIGALDARHVLVAGGSANGVVPASFTADLATGILTPLASDLLVPRARATVTAFAGGAVVAGGMRPDTGELLASAEVFTGTDFDGAPILLSEGRAQHGAALLATGETLLVGGVGARGALASLELVDSTKRRSQTAGLAQLDSPRAKPIVLRLASGEILVAGGVDDQGAAVGALEWLSADGRDHKQSRPFPASLVQDFVALPAGGALAVLVPATPSPEFQNVWIISADRTADPATSLAAPMTAVRLFQGTVGAPVLYTGQAWFRWQPWLGAFEAMADLIAGTGPDRDTFVSPDHGLAAWLTADSGNASIFGVRFDTRDPYTTDSAHGPLLTASTNFLSPDRLVSQVATSITFDAARGLVLDTGASAFLTDATFAAFSLDLTVTGPAPIVVLRDEGGAELEIGGGTCPIVVPNGAASLHVERDGSNVSVTFDAGAGQTCPAPAPPAAPVIAAGARVSVGLRGGSSGDRSSGKDLVVTRR